MSLDHDDPRLTAYALNQLHGRELAEFEALLAEDEAARAALHQIVDEIRAVARLVEQVRAHSELPGQNPKLRQEVVMRLNESAQSAPQTEDSPPAVDGQAPAPVENPSPAPTKSPSRRRWWLAAAAAGVLVGASAALLAIGNNRGWNPFVARAPHAGNDVALGQQDQFSGSRNHSGTPTRTANSHTSSTAESTAPAKEAEGDAAKRPSKSGVMELAPVDNSPGVPESIVLEVPADHFLGGTVESTVHSRFLRSGGGNVAGKRPGTPDFYFSRQGTPDFDGEGFREADWFGGDRSGGGSPDGGQGRPGYVDALPEPDTADDNARTSGLLPRRPASSEGRPASATLTPLPSHPDRALPSNNDVEDSRSNESKPDSEAEKDNQNKISRDDKDGKSPSNEQHGKDPKQVQGQQRPATWRRSSHIPNTSRLMIGENEELPLQGMQANVAIDGFRARVVLDLYYLNDRNRQFEGNFDIRLPNEASLYFFAFGETIYKPESARPQREPAFFNVERGPLPGSAPKQIMLARHDTWQEPREARMVPRETAAYAYRETVRRRVDPALVEWAGAGLFHARVFPLAPQKLHRIVIGYDVNLQEVAGQTGSDLVYRLDLPEALPHLLVDINLADTPDELVVAPQAKPTQLGARRNFRFNDPKEKCIELRWRRPSGILLTGADETGPYFAARFAPQLPSAPEATPARDAVFLVDTSLSANPDRFNVYLKLLAAMLEKNRESMPRFAVLFFNVESHWWKEAFTANTAENVASLIEDCHKLALEGATDMQQAIRAAAQPAWLEQAESAQRDYFLLSDGAITWGQGSLAQMAEDLKAAGPLFAYGTGLSGDDTQVLAWLARESGGAAFAVVSEDQIAQAAVAHRARPWQIQEISVEGGSDLLLAGRPRNIFPGQTLLLVGRGTPAENADVVLQLTRAGEVKTIRTKLAQVLQSDLTARVYGQVAVGGLEDLVDATRDVAVAYARHFRVTGATCSLLMLESEADYERFGIKPEEDAFVVKSVAAGALMERVLAEAQARRKDARKSFVAWLERMEKAPGMEFQISPALKIALENAPSDAFAVQPRPLVCKLRQWSDLPPNYQDEQISTRPLAYEAVLAEAQRRLNAAGADDALKAISSLVEQSPGDSGLARDVGFNALEWGRPDQAYALFRRASAARPFEPQSYQALAQCATAMGNLELALAYYELAVTAQWDSRFGDFAKIVGLDYLRFLRRFDQGTLNTSLADFAKARLQSIEEKYGIGQPDLVVTMAWNTDGTDVDLHVLEPTGEECYFQQRQTRIGGELSQDVTQGLGPEMYVLRKAIPGKYHIKAHYYSSDANRASTRTKVHVTVIRNWGAKAESVEHKTVLLENGKQVQHVVTVEVN